MTETPPGSPRGSRRRLFAVVGLFALLWTGAHFGGLLEAVDVASIRGLVERAGPWGVLLFVAAFSAGVLLHVPGMLFVAAGILAYGRIAGFGVTLAGAVVAISVSFVVVRTVGGRALATIERPFLRRLLERLETRPITTVAALRVVFWVAPPLNYALALTSIRFRDYLIGSAAGLVPPLVVATLFFDWLLARLGV